MENDIKSKWAEALEREGKEQYKQGTNCLRREDRFCCLGVLCDLYGKEKGIEWKREDNFGFYTFLGESSVLPKEVVEWAGLPSRNPLVFVKDFPGYEELVLSDVNDKGRTFKEISKVLRDNTNL